MNIIFLNNPNLQNKKVQFSDANWNKYYVVNSVLTNYLKSEKF